MIDSYMELSSANSMHWALKAKRYIKNLNTQEKAVMSNPMHINSVRSKMISIIRPYGVDGRDYYNVGQALFNWATSPEGYTYAKDPVGFESFQNPLRTLCIPPTPDCGYEDCDGQSLANASLLDSIDVPFVWIYLAPLVKYNPQNRVIEEVFFTHVFTAVVIPEQNEKMVPIDTINKPGTDRVFYPYGQMAPWQGLIIYNPRKDDCFLLLSQPFCERYGLQKRPIRI